MASELVACAKDIEDKLLSTEEALNARDAVFSKKGKDMSSTHQLVADALARLHEALSKKVMLEKATCSDYFVEVPSQGVTVLCCIKDTYPNLKASVKFNIHKVFSWQLVSAHKDKKKLGMLLGNYRMSLSEAQAIAEEVAAASQSSAIIVNDEGESEPFWIFTGFSPSPKACKILTFPKTISISASISRIHMKKLTVSLLVALLVLALASMEVNNEVEAGTASNSQSAETNHSHSSSMADVEDGSPSEASDEGPSFCTGTGFIINFAQEPDYQYFFGVPAEPDNHQDYSSIPPNEGVFIMDPLEVNPAYLHPSLFMALPSGEVPPHASTSGDTSSPGTCMLIIDTGNPFEERGWHQRMIVTPHHGILHPMLTPKQSPHLFQFPCSPEVLERAQQENPLTMELLKSIASKSVTELSGLPVPALRAMMNFHHVEYLHNIKLARLYAQCAKASHSICDQALANLTTKLSIEAEYINPSISESTSQVSGNVEMSSLDPPEPPSA
ncbi:hypothetical protein BT96DRAFT_1001575 [Gymnopus androsaceus JB14]|uniref:Uncharacterized protein n=1 Tax=Gymnopus androsaceus JB14 TaxID=1447944 RepID=A0A6A4GZ58_9AGAR|nr:hypothetical protein BT96DRAFT_1001575 [Gymnopus androsaceus JB14]